MDNVSKYESMRAWLVENEGKTERDWLLEVRCTDDRQREELKEFFAWVDENEPGKLNVCPDHYFLKVGQQPGMPAFVNTVQTNDPTEEVQVECDFALYEMFYDLDVPESVYGQTHPWDYWKWKSDKMGLNDTNFAYQAYEYFDQMRRGIPHWNTWKDKQRY